eukprot:scaffold8075_cov115-Isochrysis_galbana.AAC.6
MHTPLSLFSRLSLSPSLCCPCLALENDSAVVNDFAAAVGGPRLLFDTSRGSGAVCMMYAANCDNSGWLDGSAMQQLAHAPRAPAPLPHLHDRPTSYMLYCQGPPGAYARRMHL